MKNDHLHQEGRRPDIFFFSETEMKIVELLLGYETISEQRAVDSCLLVMTTRIGDIRILKMILESKNENVIPKRTNFEMLSKAAYRAVQRGRCDLLATLYPSLCEAVDSNDMNDGWKRADLKESLMTALKEGCSDCTTMLLQLVDVKGYTYK